MLMNLPSPSIIYPASDGTAEACSKAEQANAIFGGLKLDRRTERLTYLSFLDRALYAFWESI